MRANSLFGGDCALQQIINCSAISLAVWNPELKKLYDSNVAVSYQTLLSVNFREGLGTRLVWYSIVPYIYWPTCGSACARDSGSADPLPY